MIAGQMAKLRQAQNEFAEITNHMREGFLVIDDKEEVLSYNKSALTLFRCYRYRRGAAAYSLAEPQRVTA